MDKLIINGGNQLSGEVSISGSKNAVLPIMTATLIVPGTYKINNVPILCGKGRFHYYEGYTFNEVGSIIEVFNHFNPKLCIITNSSGCLDKRWPIGSLMLSNQIIDFSFIN